MRKELERVLNILGDMSADTAAQIRARSAKKDPDIRFREITAYYNGYAIALETAESLIREVLAEKEDRNIAELRSQKVQAFRQQNTN
jgi:hypothetical protein